MQRGHHNARSPSRRPARDEFVVSLLRLPDRQPPRDICLGSVQPRFGTESGYLKQVASYSPDDPTLATAYRLTIAVAESITRAQSTIDHLNEELKAMVGLFPHLGLWLLPR